MAVGKVDLLWGNRWAGIVFICLGAIGAGCMEYWIPPPGIAVAVMGGVAALMAIRTKASGAEKASWMLLISSLLIIEAIAIHNDRKEHDDALAALLAQEVKARTEAQLGFSAIGTGIQSTVATSEQQYAGTTNNLESLLHETRRVQKLTSENLEHITGGDAFCYVSPSPYTMATNSPQWNFRFGNSGRVMMPLCIIRIIELWDRSDPPEVVSRKFLGNTITLTNLPPRQQGLIT